MLNQLGGNKGSNNRFLLISLTVFKKAVMLPP